MAYYAQYDNTISGPSPVIGWYDTELLSYPNLPAAANLLGINYEQWENHFVNPSGWAVHSGALVSYTPTTPALTLAQQASALLQPIGSGAGIVVTCTSNAALDGTYAIDPISQQKMVATSLAIASNLGLPGGGSTFNYPDINGAMHPWTAAEFPKLAQAAMNFVYAVDMVLAGQSTSLPSNTVTIA